MIRFRLVLTCALWLCTVICAVAQAPGSRQSGSMSPGAPTAGNGQPQYKPGNAWTLTVPLGLHVDNTIDTLTYNYQQRNLPAMGSDAWATTGNLGAEGLNMLFFGRPKQETFFFDDALARWLPSLRTQRLFNVYQPNTVVQYNFGGGRQNKTDRLQADFAGNVNRRIGVGASMDYLYSKGCYENQATKDFSVGLNAYYLGDRYEFQGIFQQFNFLNKENGGITDDLYITDPAELQGGVDKIEAKSIPTRLSTAHNRVNGANFFMTHAWKVGFWEDEEVNDTLTRQRYVPVTRFIYSLDYHKRHHFFINTNTTQAHDFWENFYLDPSRTDEDQRYWSLTNTVGFEMIEGFKKWMQFGLSAYASWVTRRFRQSTDFELPELTEEQINQLTPLPAGFSVAPQTTLNSLVVGGRLSRTRGSIIRYNADARFGITGDMVGDIDLHGEISTRFRLFGDTVEIAADAALRNLTPSYLLRHYISNHFAWDNNFGKERTVEIGGHLNIPWTHTVLSARVANLQNRVYFNANSLPAQYGGSIQIFSASLSQKLKAGIWHWDNTITYQATANADVLPLPALTVYSNMYIDFRAFNVLRLLIGLDCDYYTSYYGMEYQPATMTFHVQDASESRIKVGNYPLCNAYITARLYKVRFYVMYSHVNQGLFSKNYFSMPHYPINPGRLQFGLSVDFPN
ncbi:MAG: putative porin [Muribaculaceae bacterium]|nr:putative porin [Muribaculaceae bacterium]